MAMGTRKKRERQEALWYGGELPAAPGHPFYNRLNEVLEKADFDGFCEDSCASFYDAKLGRPSLPPGMYFRIMMIGFFEGIDSERGVAWRLADSLTLRQFLSIGLDERTPDHVTISRTRRLIDGETHQRIFTWVLERLARGGLVRGKTIGVDSTTLEANAAMKSIVRRDTGESYMEYLKRLAKAEDSMRRMQRPCGAWIASAKSACPTRFGRIRTIRIRRSRGSKMDALRWHSRRRMRWTWRRELSWR
jgi:transposase